jgi:hypothetical protein
MDAGIEVVEQVPCEAPANPHSFAYLRTKKEKPGHSLALGRHASVNPDPFLRVRERFVRHLSQRMILEPRPMFLFGLMQIETPYFASIFRLDVRFHVEPSGSVLAGFL